MLTEVGGALMVVKVSVKTAHSGVKRFVIITVGSAAPRRMLAITNDVVLTYRKIHIAELQTWAPDLKTQLEPKSIQLLQLPTTCLPSVIAGD